MEYLQLFEHEEFGSVRIIEKDGAPWWVLKDVCDILGLSDVRRVAERLEEDELTGVKLHSGGQNREMYAVNEYGLWNVVLRSDKPIAKGFKRWLTHDVIPAIRQTGGYALGGGMELIIKTVTAAVLAQLPAIIDERIKAAIDGGYAGNSIAGGTDFKLLDDDEDLSGIIADTRQEKATLWESILKEWQRFRGAATRKGDADKAFIKRCRKKYPGNGITLRTLYRKLKLYEENGLEGLIDHRGDRWKKIKITVEVE